MKALKIAVVGLLIVVAGLLFEIRRLANRTAEAPAAAPVAQVTKPAEAPTPAPSVVAPAAEPEKPSPVAPKRHVTKPRAAAAPAAPPPAAAEPQATAASTAPPAPAPGPAPAAEATPPPPPAPRRVTLPAGTPVVVRTQNTLSTARNLKGDTFTASLDQPLVADGYVIAEKGADVEGVVVRAEKAGRVEGVAALEVELVRLRTSDGQKLSIATNLHDVAGQRSRGSDAKKIGAATGIGAIIGAIAGGGKGAAIGAGVGAGAGAGGVLATRGKDATIPSESVLVFHLKTPVEVVERR